MFVHSAANAPVDPFQFNEAHLCEEHCSSKSRQTGSEKRSSRRPAGGILCPTQRNSSLSRRRNAIGPEMPSRSRATERLRRTLCGSDCPGVTFDGGMSKLK